MENKRGTAKQFGSRPADFLKTDAQAADGWVVSSSLRLGCAPPLFCGLRWVPGDEDGLVAAIGLRDPAPARAGPKQLLSFEVQSAIFR